MIERFNFYDVYGYLIPGFVWLLLLAVPFHLLYGFAALSATEFTAGLAVAYLAGHLLGGLARRFIGTEKFAIPVKDDQGEIKDKSVPRSIAIFWERYPYKDKLPPTLRSKLAEKFKARFGYDPVTPFKPTAGEQEQEHVTSAKLKEIGEIFYLCRTSLAQAKLASYVEQYQGMNSLTRSLSLAFCLVAVTYSTWAMASSWQLRSSGPRWMIPFGILVVGGALAFVVNLGINAATKADRRMIAHFDVNAEQVAFCGILALVAIAFSRWEPLPLRQCYALAAGAGASWLMALRLRSASDAFDESLVSAIYRDFVALESESESETPKPKPAQID